MMVSRIEFQNSKLQQGLVFGAGAALLGVAGFKLYQLLKAPAFPGRPVSLLNVMKNPFVCAPGAAGTVVMAAGCVFKFTKGSALNTDQQKLADQGLQFGHVEVDLNNEEGDRMKVLKQIATRHLTSGKIAVVVGTESEHKAAFVKFLIDGSESGGLAIPKEKVLDKVEEDKKEEILTGAIVFAFPGSDPVSLIKDIAGNKAGRKLLEKITVQEVTVKQKERAI
ncbi:MAG: hypothetical protein JSR80_08530 [Verrucomicrobia bacterium]|nr:hypothetical protein [Verrucomicrobiota bacterium]